MKENEIAAVVVDSAFRLHAGLGLGIFEIVYEVSLVHELRKRGYSGERQSSACSARKCAQINLRGSCSERAVVFVLGAADQGGQLSHPFGRRVRAKPDHCACEFK
jgi:hypothetical protein